MGAQEFETVMATHHAEIYRYCLRVTSGSSDAEDLSQETFLRAYRAYTSLPAESNVRAWLFTIATNLCRNYFRTMSRRRKAHTTVKATRTEMDSTGPESESAAREATALIETLVDGLPFKQRLAFTMRKMHDLDYDAIAASLDCSAETARAHVFQALRKIRHGLNGHAFLVESTR